MLVPHSDHWAFGGGFSLVAWAKPDVIDMKGRIIYHFDGVTTDGISLWQRDAGAGVWSFVVWTGGAVVCDSDVAPTGEWQHVVGTRTPGGVCTLYVDGIAQADVENKPGAIDSTDPLYIGRNSAGTELFNGDLSDLRIYGRCLSLAEIQHIYRLTLRRPYGDLLQRPTRRYVQRHRGALQATK